MLVTCQNKVAFTEVVPDQLCSCLDLNKTTEAKVKGVHMCGSVGKSVDLYSTNSCSHLSLSPSEFILIVSMRLVYSALMSFRHSRCHDSKTTLHCSL